MRKIVVGCSLFLMLACSHAEVGDAPERTRTDVTPQNDLVTSLEVDVGSAAVRFVLHVTNSGDKAVVLEFSSAQKYDFEVQTAGGSRIWRWSDDQMFAQMLSQETIPAGATVDYTASWQPGSTNGRLIAIGRVPATGRKIEQRTEFELTKR